MSVRFFLADPELCPAFGFLGGKEVKEAGIANAGIHDRALLLRALEFVIPQWLSFQNDLRSDGSIRTSQRSEEILRGSQCKTHAFEYSISNISFVVGASVQAQYLWAYTWS